MGRIDVGRVVLGGLAAGLVINIGESILNLAIIAEESAAALAALGLPPVAPGTVMVFIVFGFLIGVATVWLYAAMRPRFGPGPKTAALAGVVVWGLAFLWPAVVNGMMNLAPARLYVTSVVWGLIEMVVAALIGGALYREEPAGQ